MSYLFSSSAQKITQEVNEYSTLEVRDFLINNYLNNATLINQYWREIKPKNIRITFKHYQKHDLFNLFYVEDISSYFNKNRKSQWTEFIRKLTIQEEYLKLKKYTVNDEDLSALITARIMRKLVEQRQQQQNNTDINVLIKEVKNELKNAITQAEEFKNLKNDAKELITILGGNTFSHDSLSLLKYLQSPDEFRRRVKILKDTFMMLKNFNETLPASFKKSQLSSNYGEINNVEKLMKETQITHMISSEYSYLALANNSKIAKTLFALRYVNKELLIYRGTASPKVSLYIDKSGSMASNLENIPKISLATGLGLALLKKFDDTRIYMFDTEVTEVDKSRMVQTLLTIVADGGTNISLVLQKIKQGDDRKTVHIIISDGIDQVGEDVINSISNELRRRIVFILIETNAPQWLQKNFHYYPVKSIAEFQQAITKSLESQL